MTPEERLSAIGNLLADEEKNTPQKKRDGSNERTLEVGDEIEVYIRGVFPQSGRFMVTTDSNVKKIKGVKQDREAEKRLARLESKLGGEKGVENILNSVGKVMEGEIKAASKTGDWFYVQPTSDEGLPVGIGACDSSINEPLKANDKVQISFEGIDYSRGQLSFKITDRV